MTKPTTTVGISFDLSAVDPNFFTLDDPIKGELDNVTYLLAGEIIQDVTEYVRRVSVSRGRSRELDRYSTGQATIVLDNRTRIFDPNDLATPYIGQILPRKAVQISVDDQSAIVGNVQDWSFLYELTGDATATVTAVDGFSLLTRQAVDNLSVSTQTTNNRVNTILDSVSWPAGKRDIATGTATLGTGVATGNALTYLQNVETCEAGDFFISRNGLATFKSRGIAYDDTAYDAALTYDQAVTPYSFPSPSVTSDLIFTDEADDGSSTFVPYAALQLELGTDLLFNTVNMTYGTATITAEDAESQTTYGLSTLDVNASLLSTAAQGTALAEYLVSVYRQPVARFSEVTVELNGLPTAVLDKLLTLDLTDVVKVRFRPNSIYARVERRSIIEGIKHDVSIDSHRVTFSFSGAPGS
jgi:hypothetical protein